MNFREFAEWLDANRDVTVSEVFHDIVANSYGANKRDFEKMLRKAAPKPRKLKPCGTGAFLDDHQFCFEMGWREGIAAYRKMLREEFQKEVKE